MMKKLLIGLVVAAVGYHFCSSRGWHSRSYYASKALAAPSPVLTEQEVSEDSPDDSQFDNARWIPASKEDALVFAETGEDDHCSNAWRDDARNPGWGSYFEKTSLMGRRGICIWYKMRKMKEGGLLKAAFTRPGPRLATPPSR
jgi:hypothetical protein